MTRSGSSTKLTATVLAMRLAAGSYAWRTRVRLEHAWCDPVCLGQHLQYRLLHQILSDRLVQQLGPNDPGDDRHQRFQSLPLISRRPFGLVDDPRGAHPCTLRRCSAHVLNSLIIYLHRGRVPLPPQAPWPVATLRRPESAPTDRTRFVQSVAQLVNGRGRDYL